MRKLLMASGAILGASASLAMAQTVAPAPSQGQLVAPYGGGPSYTNNNNGWGIANTPSGSAAAGGLSTYGSLGQNYYPVPAPGTITIRLGGKVEADFTAAFGVANNGPSGKVNPVQIGSYMRLYPGFDGMSTNGIRYGAQIELRTNWGSQAGSASANTSTETVFVRRAFTYIGTDTTGIVRLGQGDGLISLYDNCIFTTQCFDAGVGVQQGAFTSTLPNTNVTGGGGLYPWLAQAGAEYGNNKVVYMSPQIYGLDVGLQYAPGQGNAFANSAGGAACSTAGTVDNCNGVTTGANSSHWYNQFGVGARYEHTFGPVDVKAYGFYEISGHEGLTTGKYTVGGAPSASGTLHYNGLDFYQVGAAVTTQGLTLAATHIGGKDNGQLGLVPTGGADMDATIGGLTYINGPWVVGANIGLITNQGDATLAGISQRYGLVTAVGGNYKVAPGINLVLEYEYNHQHQGGYDFVTNTHDKLNNDVDSQGFTFSTMLTW
jgi:hypothetical protein